MTPPSRYCAGFPCFQLPNEEFTINVVEARGELSKISEAEIRAHYFLPYCLFRTISPIQNSFNTPPQRVISVLILPTKKL
jgi:hypothetical protein